MPLLFWKYPTTFVRLMVSEVRNSTATPATNSSASATATNVLPLRFIARPPQLQGVLPHRGPAPARGSASALVCPQARAVPRREVLGAGVREGAGAAALDRGSSQ